MFSRLSLKLSNCLHQLQVTFISPPSVSSLSEAMSNQVAIFTSLVLRLDASQGEYESGRLSLTFTAQPYAYLWTGFNWMADCMGFLVAFGFLPLYSHLCGVALGLPDYESLALSAYIVFTFFEYLWASQIGPLLCSPSRNLALDFLHSYVAVSSAKSPTVGLSGPQVTRLLHTFNQLHRIVRRYWGLALLGCLLNLGQFLVTFLAAIGPNGLGLLQVSLYLALLANYALQGVCTLVFGHTLACQVYLLLLLLKFKLQNALGILQGEAHLPLTIRKFTYAYISLNGEITQFNSFLCKYIYITDTTLKLSGCLTIIFFYNANILLTNPFALIGSLFILTFYFAINSMFSLFSVFSEENLVAYRRLSGLYVKAHHLRPSLRKVRRSEGKGWAQRWVNVRASLAMNGLLQFLASRQFGFTYARQFPIEKKSLLENVLASIAFFILFLRKRV